MPSSEYEQLLVERFGRVVDWELELDQAVWSPPARAQAGLPPVGVFRYRRKRARADLRVSDRRVAEALAAGYHVPKASLADRRLASILMYRTGRYSMAEIGERVGKERRQVHRWVSGSGRLRLTGQGRKYPWVVRSVA